MIPGKVGLLMVLPTCVAVFAACGSSSNIGSGAGSNHPAGQSHGWHAAALTRRYLTGRAG